MDKLFIIGRIQVSASSKSISLLGYYQVEFTEFNQLFIMYRTMAMSAKPEMTITVDAEDQITIESRGLRSGTTTITFNEEFEEKTADGRDVVVSSFFLLLHG